MKKSLQEIVWRTCGRDTGSGLRGDALSGDAGNDTLIGSTGNDILLGGSGNDTLYGFGGDDRIYADAQVDNRRMRWRHIAANDEASHIWRVAA